MRKKQAKTVQFSNLSEDHKAQFLQFLIKNNICFQEGKENCTAKIAIKPTNVSKPINAQANKQKSVSKKQTSHGHQNKLHTTSERKSTHGNLKRESKPLGQLTLRNNNSYENTTGQKQLKTPTKQSGALRTSSLSCKEGSQTLPKRTKDTPKSVKPVKNRVKQNAIVSDYEPKTRSLNKNLKEIKKKQDVSKQKHHNTYEKQRDQSFCKPVRKIQACAEINCTKYGSLFESMGKGRPVRWPLGLLERTIEEIYDQIFFKNTQCLQNRNIDNALRTLHLSSFPQLIENYFIKKYKNSKLASTNLSNLTYSLSYHLSKTNTPFFLKTFEDFLMNYLQYEDALYYLFARNVLKKELKAVEKARELSRVEGTYFADKIKQKDIPKLLKGIIGRDSELLSEYKELVQSRMQGDQIQAYQFLKILVDDFHQRRLFNQQVEQAQSMHDRPLFNRDESYDRRNQELTFGEEQYNHSQTYYRPQFWECLAYSHVTDSLFQLIIDKLSKKAIEFLQILAGDTEKSQPELQRLQTLLLIKAESLVKAVFEMNKMKWFRELSIADPSEEDMATVENVQMRLRRLREAPSGRDIGEFCKSILTVPQLVNELQFSITPNDS